jgi:hypothetical protein
MSTNFELDQLIRYKTKCQRLLDCWLPNYEYITHFSKTKLLIYEFLVESFYRNETRHKSLSSSGSQTNYQNFSPPQLVSIKNIYLLQIWCE